jgi:hypothetical protein
MPFDPKLIHADEPPLAANGELNLPSDLAGLAEQLRDDAAHLSAAYPPTIAAHSPLLRSNQTRRTAALIASASAASLAALLAGFVVFWQRPESIPQKHSPVPSTPSHLVTSTAASETVISLTELSSPELEALIDLMERSPDNAVRVSF